jgi:hypothetical protein
MLTKHFALIAVPLAVAGLAGCGGSSGSKSSSSPQSSQGSQSTQSSQNTKAADAASAATGDIPDTQNFLTYKDPKAGFSIRYPEGWTQNTSATGVSFQDKNNIVRVDIRKGAPPTVASETADLTKLKASDPALSFPPPKPFSVKGTPAIKDTYTTKSKPNPVTGKTEILIVDRYELGKNGKVAVVDLGTAKGVDNVDAYRMMIESFKWQ